MLELIRSCAIKSLSKDPEGVRVIYQDHYYRDAKGTYIYRPQWADPMGFPAYMAAAREVRDRCGPMACRDSSDPGEVRWISVEEGRQLLEASEIKTFSYGLPNSFAEIEAAGTRTGVKLIDHRWVKHMWVDPDMESATIPIARRAQVAGKHPQFAVNGHYEPVPTETQPDSGLD